MKRTELLKEEADLLKAQNKGKDVTDRLNEVCAVNEYVIPITQNNFISVTREIKKLPNHCLGLR